MQRGKQKHICRFIKLMHALTRPGPQKLDLVAQTISARALLKPAPEAALELVPIGPAINRADNDAPATQAPIGEAIRAAPTAKPG